MRNHKGYTLIELMVALVILVLVTGSIFKLLRTNQRMTRAQAERVDLQSNVRTASLVIPSELRELNTVIGGTVDQNDILSMTATSIQYRAMRGIGYICQTPTVGEIRILKSTWSGLRDPVAVRDGAYVFVDGNTDLSTDDLWLPVVITAVNLGSTCPGGAAAYSLTISPPAAALPSVSVLTPVRIYEVEELSLYASGGQSWLGARSVSAGEVAPQPLLGPLVGGTGIALTYLDINNVVTAVPANVKSIRLTVTGIGNQATASYGGSSQTSVARDTLTTQVSLRNAVRP